MSEIKQNVLDVQRSMLEQGLKHFKSRSKLAKFLGMKRQLINRYFNQEIEMRLSTYLKIKAKIANHAEEMESK